MLGLWYSASSVGAQLRIELNGLLREMGLRTYKIYKPTDGVTALNGQNGLLQWRGKVVNIVALGFKHRGKSYLQKCQTLHEFAWRVTTRKCQFTGGNRPSKSGQNR
ncbi:hypothetical protein A2U01_0019079, partial [Trifolium medium]|nr:hypothetical protein [Trifolium medium]